MPRLPVLTVAALLAAPALAHAGGVLDELSAGTAPGASGGAASSWIADRLGAIWDVTEDWQLRLDVSGTRYLEQPATTVATVGASIEYDPDAHWSLRLAGGGSPRAETRSSQAVKAQTATGAAITVDAAVRSATSSITGSASVGYDTAGDTDAETSVLVTATALSLASDEQVTDVSGRGGQSYTIDQLRAFCASRPCAGGLSAALAGTATRLGELVLAASVSEQLYRDTDVGIDGAYYLYDQDPTQTGTYSITRAGQTSLGGSLGIAPLAFRVGPTVSQRLGPLSATAAGGYSRYVDGLGWAADATVRVQLKIDTGELQRLKLWLKLSGQRDVDQMAQVTKAGAISIGAQYAW